MRKMEQKGSRKKLREGRRRKGWERGSRKRGREASEIIVTKVRSTEG